MDMRTAGLCIVLGLMVGAAFASAHSPAPDVDDPDASFEQYKQARRDLYDALHRDPSPRVQVLAGRIYLSDDDTPSALRPKREDVVTRAARLAPDDAFVQWMAADQGSYTSSQCGPTRWPEAEVANLVRLEGDNAGALQFAVALAHAKGDQAALDEALARMAAAPRADDHLGEEIAAWRRAHAAHPIPGMIDGVVAGSTAEASALRLALQETAHRYSSATTTLETVCKPNAQSERAWQRLGWCTDAGRLLATRGNSFALREQGLKLLAASGTGNGDVAELQRQFDWLQAHAANPIQNFAAFRDAPADLVANWQGAANEIVATERRLKRLGEPLTAPPGWVKSSAEPEADAEESAARNAWQEYLRALIEDMRTSSDVHMQALALAADRRIGAMFGESAPRDEQTPATTVTPDPLTELAATNPDNLIVQWIAATTAGEGSAAAIANVQRLDGGNAAAWALSLSRPDADAPPVLQRMAASGRYDEHMRELLAPWVAAVQKRPVPPEVASASGRSSGRDLSSDAAGQGTALMMAMMNSTGASPFGSLHGACAKNAAADAQAGESCAAIGRLMLNSGGSLITAMIGETLLRNMDALGAREQERARQIAWWQTQIEGLDAGPAFDAYLADYLSTGSEIEALRLTATRAGKAEPPADWKSPAEKRAAKGK